MKENVLRYTLRVNRQNFQKFRFIAAYESRSVNKVLELYIKQRVTAFESAHGCIKIESLPPK